MGRRDNEKELQERIESLEEECKTLLDACEAAEKRFYKEVDRRKEDASRHNFEIHKKDFKIEELQKKKDWEIEIACNLVRKELEQQIIDADLAAAKAETALEVYKSVDNKEERKANAENFTKLIDGIVSAASSSPTINVQPPSDVPF